MKNKVRLFLFLSLMVSIPINIFFGIWLYKTVTIYNNLDKFNETLPRGSRLIGVMESEYKHLIYKTQNILGINKKSDVNLFIKPNKINQLTENLPLSGNSYKDDAVLIYDGKALIGKSKIRGDFFYHWAFPRKSWRFKTSKDSIFENTHKINFIIPKHESLLTNHLAYQLAQELNLLVPKSRLVDFSINGVYNGIRLMAEQIDESFLRKNKRVPGDIYKGDNIAQKQYIGVNVSIFNNPSIWEKSAYNNHYEKDNKYPLFSAFKDLSVNNFKSFDLKNFAAMSVLIDLSASYHFDNRHNWVLYYDSYLEKFSPIIWDVNGWFSSDESRQNANIITSDIFEKFYHNYNFIREKYIILNEFYNFKIEDFKNILKSSVNRAKELVDRNGYTFTLGRRILKNEKALNTIDLFAQRVHDQLSKIEKYFVGSVNINDYKYALIDDRIRLSISGTKLIKGIIIKLKNSNLPAHISIAYAQGNKVITKDITNHSKIKNDSIAININLLAQAKIFSKSNDDSSKLDFNEATYDLNLTGIVSSEIKSITLKFDNKQLEEHKIKQVQAIKQINFDENLSNILSEDTNDNTQVWSGSKYFTGFNVVNDNVIINKGTKLIFSDGATLKMLGRMTAQGTKNDPIVFQALDPSKPWGAFVLKDERADNSILRNVIFKNGSGHKGKLHEYTAMLSIHNVNNVLVEDGIFKDNKITDDMVHVIYSDVQFKGSTFLNSNADALDADISNIVVNNCKFSNSGNDSIDLMTSKAVVINSRFVSSSDKGISIGEDSQSLVINNTFKNNHIGIQSKDNSKINIYNTNFIHNNKALDAYHKNWRYSEGGTINISNSIFENNSKNATVGKKSSIALFNCKIDKPNNFDLKHIRNNKITINKKNLTQHQLKDPLFIKYKSLIHNETKGTHE